MLNKNKKQEKCQPTLEEFLQFRPKRLDFEWSENDEGLVEIKVPKFKSNFGKSFCKLFRKDPTFFAKMDKIGSLVWKNSDGKQTLKEILEKLKKEFPDEEKIEDRLFYFLYQMHNLNYIRY